MFITYFVWERDNGATMLINTYTKGKFGVINVLEDLTLHANPSSLKTIVDDFASKGVLHVAFAFTPNTFPSSRLMAVLVNSREALKKQGGTLAIIAPNEKMLDTFNVLNLAHGDYFLLVESEEELLPQDKKEPQQGQ
jgi:anti-anti-sigma regulatory factor